ncbi:MAG: hypothetical protein ACRCZF_26310, partial [Gemmataceae bacterium]
YPGWALPVRASAHAEQAEVEPNNDRASSPVVPVPVGISARFAAKNDRDCFRFPVKKGTKYEAIVQATELSLLTEVDLQIQGSDGANIARSDPAKAIARVEWTAAADAELLAIATPLNYQYGPNEVYRLVIRPLTPSVEVTLGNDRMRIAPNGESFIPISDLQRRNGWNRPVELRLIGVPGVTGTLTISANQNATKAAPLMLLCKASAEAKPGFVPGRVEVFAEEKFLTFARTETLRSVFAAPLNAPPEWSVPVAIMVDSAVPKKLTPPAPAAPAKTEPKPGAKK